QMAGKNLLAKQADFRSFYTCLTASRCKGFERILIKGLAPIFDIIRSNSLSVLDFLFVQQSLFTTAICFPTEDNWQRLDQAFRQFYTEIRFINYIAKVLWRYAKDFRVKYQRDEARYLCMLDEPIQIKGESSAITYKDQLVDHRQDNTPKGETLLDQVEDLQLQKALKQLTDKQLRVLDGYYVHNMTQKE